MQLRTSKSHPLQISWMELGMGWGQIGITLCPGKSQMDGISGQWDRDLETDMADIRGWGAHHVITLLTDFEIVELKVAGIGAQVESSGMTWHHFPIEDGSAPEDMHAPAWSNMARTVGEALSHGENVLVHCKGGLGRSGSFVAGLLAENGVEPYKAIGKTREARNGAIETSIQEAWVHKQATEDGPLSGSPLDVGVWAVNSAPTMLDRFRGCMLGGAVGDALGAPVEFLNDQEIVSKFGSNGIENYAPAYGRNGAITDDTQMAMFTAEGCIRSFTRYLDRGLSSPKGVIRYAYHRWSKTQGEKPASEGDGFFKFVNSGWLIDIQELHSRRAPGNTCLSALTSGSPVTESKGCGGVMRVAPVGLLGATGQFNGSVYELGSDSASITHGHPSGYIASGALAEIIFEMTNGSSIQESCESALRRIADDPEAGEVITSLTAALKLASEDMSPLSAITQLGSGWVAEEALAIGVYASLVAHSFSDGIRIAVNHSGDSDSTGSITGQILGTALGAQAIDSTWLEHLELRREIEVLAHDLYSVSFHGKGAEQSPQFIEKYPPN